MSFATLRTTLAASIANPSMWSTYSFPPAQVTANSVSITPDDSYVEIINNNTALSCKVRFVLECAVPLFDNQGNLAGIEDLILALVPLINHTGYTISNVSQPRIMALPSGDLLTCSIRIETLTSWS
jgi:hypothetical protein